MSRGACAATLAGILCVGTSACSRGPPPPECADLPTIPADDGLAPFALAQARERLRAARSANERAEKAWFSKKYDVAACKAAHEGAAEAQRRREVARALRDQYEAGGATADEVVKATRSALSAPEPWVAAGLVDGDASVRLDKMRARVDEMSMALTVARAELEAAGWDVPQDDRRVTALVAARTSAVSLMSEAEALGAEVAEAAIKRCSGGNSGGLTLHRAKSFNDWMIMSGTAGSTRGALLYAFEPERRTCELLEKVTVEGNEVIPDTEGETLHEWTIASTVPIRVLVGWTPRGAWFVTRDGGWRTFTHDPGCPLAPAGCGAPRVTRTEITARCSCGTDRDAMRDGKVRYAWDGDGVIAEE